MNKPRTAKSAPLVMFKILISENTHLKTFNFTENFVVRYASGPFFFQKTNDRRLQNLWYFSLGRYWITHISQKLLELDVPKNFEKNGITKGLKFASAKKFNISYKLSEDFWNVLLMKIRMVNILWVCKVSKASKNFIHRVRSLISKNNATSQSF